MQTERELSELEKWLQGFTRWRWLAVVGIAAVAVFPTRVVGVVPQALPLLVVAALVATYNLVFWLLARASSMRKIRGRLAVAVANAQISLDLVALTVVLYLTGGVENPFYLYYIFHIIMASILLSATHTFLQTGLAICLFGGIALAELAGLLPHVPFPGASNGQAYREPNYVFSVVLAFASALILASMLGTSIVGKLRIRERETTELKEALERERQEALDAYERISEVERHKSRYILKASHELRAPLDTIESQLSVIVEGFAGVLPDRARDLVQRALVRIREVRGIIIDLLILSRAQRTVPTEEIKPIDIGREVDSILSSFNAWATQKDVRLSCSVDPDLPNLYCDPEGIRNLLSNLISNAVRYTPPSGSILVSAGAEPTYLRLAVSDSGIGIDHEDQKLIFEEFYRTRQAREMVKDGSGLGLAIVKAIVQTHGGSILIDSQPGRGSTFTVRLPYLRSQTE